MEWYVPFHFPTRISGFSVQMVSAQGNPVGLYAFARQLGNFQQWMPYCADDWSPQAFNMLLKHWALLANQKPCTSSLCDRPPKRMWYGYGLLQKTGALLLTSHHLLAMHSDSNDAVTHQNMEESHWFTIGENACVMFFIKGTSKEGHIPLLIES